MEIWHEYFHNLLMIDFFYLMNGCICVCVHTYVWAYSKFHSVSGPFILSLSTSFPHTKMIGRDNRLQLY